MSRFADSVKEGFVVSCLTMLKLLGVIAIGALLIGSCAVVVCTAIWLGCVGVPLPIMVVLVLIESLGIVFSLIWLSCTYDAYATRKREDGGE